jgi:hypothetical protein
MNCTHKVIYACITGASVAAPCGMLKTGFREPAADKKGLGK